MSNDPNESTGGKGESTSLSRSDLALLRKAARERWGVPDPVKTEALYRIHKVLAESDSDRDVIAAAKTLALLDRIDQQDERLDFEKQKAALETADEERETTDPEAAARALKAANADPASNPQHPADDA